MLRYPLLLLVALVPGATASCQTPAPSQADAHPAPRGYANLVYHPSGRLVLFGGEANRRMSLNDTWTYDLATNRWQELATEPQPVDGGGVTVAYDRESDRLVAYFTTHLDRAAPKGYTRLSETWALDVARGRWTNLNPPGAPFGLMGSRMVYDAAADKIILFGGADFTATPVTRFDQTWVFDFNTNTWTQRHPATSPPGRSYFGMVYDAAADKVLIFGGSFAEDAGEKANELWAYDYGRDTWERIPYSGAVRSDHHPAMAYDPVTNRTYYSVERSLWAFDYASRAWTPLPTDSTMGIRHFHNLVADERTGRLVLFGGGPQGLHYDNQVWAFDPRDARWELRDPASP